MIIEFFGPPGSGKTTFANELARRLRAQGYEAGIVRSYHYNAGKWAVDIFGLAHLVRRVLAAILSTARNLSSYRRRELETVNTLFRLMPPASLLWRVRLWQYILHLACRWTQAERSPDIEIFDQGFIQAVGSLAMFSGAASPESIAQTLRLAPKSDLVVRITVPRDIVERRLHSRMAGELLGERLFEASLEASLRSVEIFEQIGKVRADSGLETVSVGPLDRKSTSDDMGIVENLIIAQLSQIKEKTPAHHGTGQCRDRRSLGTNATAGTGGSSTKPNAVDPINGSPAAVEPRSATAHARIQTALPHSVEAETRLAYAGLSALVIYICGAGLTSVAQLIMARLVGTMSFGIYSYAMAWTTIIAYFSTLGFNVSLVRLVPSYRAQGRFDLARGVILFALRRSLMAAAAAGLAGTAVIVLRADSIPVEMKTSLLLGMAAIPLITAFVVGSALLRAFGGVVSALLPERIIRDGMLMILLGLAAYWKPWTLDATLVMKAVLISSAVTVGIVAISAIRLWPAELRVKPAALHLDWWATAPPIMLIAGLDILISRTGIMVLGWTENIRGAGIFALALSFALLVGLSRIAVSSIFSPAAAGLHAIGDLEGLQKLFSRATLLSFAGAIVTALPLLAILDPLLGWFGEDFRLGAPIARILILGYVVAAFFGPQQHLMIMTGNAWAAAKTMAVGALANILGCVIGMQYYGSSGAAAGIAIALLIWNVLMSVYIKKRMHILPGLLAAAPMWRSV
jgi:O-antigen/teichoic acid export membrane protein